MDQSALCLESQKVEIDLNSTETTVQPLNESTFIKELNISFPTQHPLTNTLNSVHEFKEFLIKFYKDFGYDLNKIQAATSQIEYIYNLFVCVYTVGGWSYMNGTNSWGALSKAFGSMQGVKLREDYENFLYALEKAHGVHKYEDRIVDSSLIDFNPELMVVFEWFSPNLLINEVNRSMIQRFLNLECIVVPQFINRILGVSIEKFSKEELVNKKVLFNYIEHSFTLLELQGFDSFYVECPLELHSELFEELANKVPELMHWNGKDNLLRYSQSVAGVSSPLLIVMKNSYMLIGGPSYLNLNGVYLVLYGQCEYFGIHSQHMKQLNKRVQKDLGIDIFANNWKPNEQFLLSNNIEFTYIKASPGDVVVSKTDIVYWVISDFCIIVDYFLLPIFRIQESCESYKSSKLDSHKFNLPLLCIEYLNQHMHEQDPEILSTMKKVISEGVDEEYWTGTFIQEITDYRSCSICGKDLVWRYVKCPICISSNTTTSLCLKCAQEHKCKSLEYVEKYSTQDLEKFYNRLEKRTNEGFQPVLSKVSVKPAESGAGDCIKYNPEAIISKNVFTEIIRGLQKSKDPKKPEESKSVQETQWDLEKCYKKLGKKKQKIREAMENPLNGPRFNYEFESKTRKEVLDIPILQIPIKAQPKSNPLSQLVKTKTSSALSSLIKIDRKRELEVKKKIN